MISWLLSLDNVAHNTIPEAMQLALIQEGSDLSLFVSTDTIWLHLHA